MAIHQIEDIIEKVSCQFMTKAVKGRPTAPHWYPGWPLCELLSHFCLREPARILISSSLKTSANPATTAATAP